MNRYHVIIESTRSSVMVATMRANLRVVKLGVDPFADKGEAHAAVRK